MGGTQMVAELSGMPKPLLQTVFGRTLGRRIWLQCRRDTVAPQAGHKAALPEWSDRILGSRSAAAAGPVTDAEVFSGMIEYVASRAAEALRRQARQATAIGLTITYADGHSRIERARLARPTGDVRELAGAAASLIGTGDERCLCVASVNLTLTSVAGERVADGAGSLHPAMTPAMSA
jgi:impB/mucB/samB family C-terminal domain